MPSEGPSPANEPFELCRLDKTPIVLCGFMGVGKSTVGRRLAQRLGRRFIDLDDCVVDRLGRPITEVFAAGDEGLFREAEVEVLRELLSSPEPGVIALGGGTYERRETREMLRGRALVVHLDQAFDDLYPALARLRESRPLLRDKTRAEIAALFERRRANYLAADLTVTLPRDGVPRALRAVLDALSAYLKDDGRELHAGPGAEEQAN